jgi:hypothetical protein
MTDNCLQQACLKILEEKVKEPRGITRRYKFTIMNLLLIKFKDLKPCKTYKY